MGQGRRHEVRHRTARRKEDPRFLTGRARYVADIDLTRQVYAVFLYPPHAHARIRGITGTPGVQAVLTGQDWAADGLGTLDPEFMPGRYGRPQGPSHETASAISSLAAEEAEARLEFSLPFRPWVAAAASRGF
jgi:CO/xanthine dehydrogenase Mo-binding subunit